MKSKDLSKKLSLNKVTISSLSRKDLEEARGGILETYDSCPCTVRQCGSGSSLGSCITQ